MNGRYLLDTNTIIYYLKGEPAWVRFVDDTPMTQRFASVITRMELLSWRKITEVGESQVKAFLTDLTVVGVTEEVESIAVALRKSAKIKLPDAIITATALVSDATLITRDQRLVDLVWPNLRAVNPSNGMDP